MFTNEGKDLKEKRQEAKQAEREFELVNDFTQMLNNWHSVPEVYDDELIAKYLEAQAHILRNPVDTSERGVRYFAPSSTNACKRSLYHRMNGDQKDNFHKPPHQGRWQRLGTAVGEIIQMDLLFIDKHYKQCFGDISPFLPEFQAINGIVVPMWEDFAKKSIKIQHKGYTVPISGQPDGILKYKDGTRIGLEIKSKQTSYSKTGYYSMKEPGQDHIKQTHAYSLLYGVDEFIVLYVNASKKDWEMNEEDIGKYPDIRVFYEKVTDEDREQVLDYFVDVLQCVENQTPPPVDLDKWTFNQYKTATALSLTDEEYADIEKQVADVFGEFLEHQNKAFEEGKKVPTWIEKKKNDYLAALEFIKKIRNQGGITHEATCSSLQGRWSLL